MVEDSTADRQCIYCSDHGDSSGSGKLVPIHMECFSECSQISPAVGHLDTHDTGLLWRKMELLLQASRTSPVLHEAAVEVERALRRSHSPSDTHGSGDLAKALALRDRIRAAERELGNSPYGGYQWEHLGDATKDIHSLMRGLDEASDLLRTDDLPDTHGPGFLPGDTAGTYRWILVPSSTVETLRKPYSIFSEDEVAEADRDIVARWDAAKEEIEL